MNGGCFRGMCVLAILVPTYNRAPLLRRALSSLTARVDTITDAQLIVIDNNSTDDTRAVCAEFRSVRYLFEPIQGLAHARNAGIAATACPAAPEIVVFVDDDVEVAPGWIEAIRHAFERHPEIEVVDNRIVPALHQQAARNGLHAQAGRSCIGQAIGHQQA